ncbi:type II toxin-antitoxin system VapC family toxin [Haloarcula limicola]|uniref:type II toxin-antitoxin system VapC family toxin n=1 Tax=Haloarcula limicola TaxID=1429915 RepID=UPI001F508776
MFYAQHDEDTSRHAAAQRAMKAIAGGRFGRPMTSDYVYDETVTLTLSRFADSSEATTVSNRILGRADFPEMVTLLFLERAQFFEAIDIRTRYEDQSLSFTDATTVALVNEYDIDHVLSFDDDFDGIVSCLDPAAL